MLRHQLTLILLEIHSAVMVRVDVEGGGLQAHAGLVLSVVFKFPHALHSLGLSL